jgi:integrase
MKTKDLPAVTTALIEKMVADGYSQSRIEDTTWILAHFDHYCNKHNIELITVPIAVEFIRDSFGFDYYNTTSRFQTILRRPLLILFEFYEFGNYKKTHQRGSTTKIPLIFENIYREYVDHVNNMPIVLKTRERKIWSFTKYLEYLETSGITEFSHIGHNTVHEYIASLTDYAPATLRIIRTNLREAYDWLFEKRYVPFSGRQMFPLIRKDPRNKLLSYYSKAEIQQLLSCIDTETSTGKFMYAVICLLAYLGMRVGDVITLRFCDIDWAKESISYAQQKTGKLLTLPLLDEVKYSLIDYIKNGRHESADSDYIFVTMYAPYTRYTCTASIFRIVGICMRTAGINYEGRHHGPHSLRHSMATNLLSENVPISAIANIMGHASTRTTEIYLTVDETHLKEISLEVPNV